MEIPVADRALLDTNVLLAATDEGRDGHESAVASLNIWPRSGLMLYTSGQILREYLAVATCPVAQNGLGMDRSAAVANVRALRARLHLLAEDEKVSDQLLELLSTIECTGKQVHDANVVATMLVHGISTIVTMNVDDFTRFGGRLHVIGLSSQWCTV